MSNILISSAGQRVSLVNAFKNEFRKIYSEGKVFANDANPELAPACQIADGYFKVPYLNNKNYVDILIEKCISNNIKIIIPTIDTELLLLARNREQLLKNNIEPVISSVSFINKCQNKRLIHKFFNERNIKTAKEFKKNNYSLPLYIKPIDGSRSQNNFIIKSENELNNYHYNNDNLMFLEYINSSKYDEFTCDLYYGRDNKLKCVVPRKRIDVRDGEVTKSKTVKNNILIDTITKNLSIIDGAQGCLTSQFFKHKENNEIIGIEINARFGGGFPLSYFAGANFPEWIIMEYFSNESIKPNNDWDDNLLMLRYYKEILIRDSNV